MDELFYDYLFFFKLINKKESTSEDDQHTSSYSTFDVYQIN